MKIKAVITAILFNIRADCGNLWVYRGVGIIAVMIVRRAIFALVAVDNPVVVHKWDTKYADVFGERRDKLIEYALKNVISR